MQRYTIFFIIVNALHVSGCFSSHHQELNNCKHSIWYVPGLLAATASGIVNKWMKKEGQSESMKEKRVT